MKKALALMVCLLMVVGLLAACGSPSSSSTPAAGGGTSQGTLAGGDASTGDAGEVDYSTQDPYTVHILYYGDADTANVDAVAEALSALSVEKFNTTIKLIRVGFGSYLQQVNLMLSSGEDLDVFGNMGALSTLAANGMVVPMDDLLDQYGQATKAAISDNDWACVTIDGQIYGIPSNKDKAADLNFIMTKDMADELGIDPATIKTMDDVHDALVLAKEKFPTVYGLAPNVGSMVPGMPVDPLGSTSYYLGVLMDPYDSKDLTVENFFASDYYYNLAETMYQWNQEGLLMPDGATSTETHLSLRASGMMFGNFATGKPGFAEQEARNTGVEVYVSQLSPALSVTSGVAVGWSIAATSKDPGRAMQILDWLYNDFDASNISIYGVEGTNWEIKDEAQGLVGYPEGVDGNSSGYPILAWGWLNQLNSYVWENDMPDIWQQMEEFNNTAAQSPAKGFTFDANPVINEVTACQNTVDKYHRALMCGQLDPATTIPQFLSELEAAGQDTIIAEKQAQLDAWAAA